MIAPALRAALEEIIGEDGAGPATIADLRPVGGGCINEAQIVQLDDGRRFFVKTNSGAAVELFAAEAAGLTALGRTGILRVPRVVGWRADPLPLLVLEHVATGAPAPGFFAAFGRQLATLHRQATSERFGFDGDNFLGSTPQPNAWCERWTAFWRQQRLGFQLRLAREHGLADGELLQLGERLLERLERWIASPAEPPSLLHGDLWGGNFMVDQAGQPVLIDPACYYGRREAELAMTQLFGGFDRAFYDGYEEVWPLAPGAAERIEIYKLYHLLNHLNLFGPSYRASCVAILRRFA